MEQKKFYRLSEESIGFITEIIKKYIGRNISSISSNHIYLYGKFLNYLEEELKTEGIPISMAEGDALYLTITYEGKIKLVFKMSNKGFNIIIQKRIINDWKNLHEKIAGLTSWDIWRLQAKYFLDKKKATLNITIEDTFAIIAEPESLSDLDNVLDEQYDDNTDEDMKKMKVKKKYYKEWLSEPPKKCDQCSKEIKEVFIDGRIGPDPFSQWAFLCEACHKRKGVGLGIGFGQKYLKINDKWFCVEGNKKRK